MATQGIVAVQDEGGEMLFKVVAGSNGFNADELASRIMAARTALSIDDVVQLAADCRFGDESDLVVQQRGGAIAFAGNCDDELHPRFRDAALFAIPSFNPRWECGLVEYFALAILPTALPPA